MHNRQFETLKRAYLKIEELQSRLRETLRTGSEPIAIIGMGCRFPGGADTPDSFWRLLSSGADAVTEVPRERWEIDRYYDSDPDAPGKMATRWGAFLTDIDKFDSRFFNITPREAVSMDPRQRLLLEVCWEALENAARAPDSLAGASVGVFLGIIGEEYAKLQTEDDGIARIDAYYGSGSALSVASGRIAYFLGLNGPAISIDTSCSSSLVAVHLACQTLRSKECNMALAAGVNLMLLPDATIALTKHRLMASDGRCKTFDASADGYVRGEGCGAIVLKRLRDAVAQKDRILATISGTAINQDGASSGLTAPHGPAQRAVIRSALENAGAKPADIGYVEVHGTGTALGDPIEVQALGAVLGEDRPSSRPVYVGTVKTNIGHLEAAAGISSIIKTVLVLQHREIPPHLHLKTLNPFVPWDKLPVAVPMERIPWPKDAPLLAGVSSFGFSGTNVHVIVSAADEQAERAQDARPLHMLCLSAKSEHELKELCLRYEKHLSACPQAAAGDVCFTANAGRAQLVHRLTVMAESTADFAEKLKTFSVQGQPAGLETGVVEDEKPRIAFLFTGDGSQYAGMGRLLYQTQPTFQRAVDRCGELLKQELALPLSSMLYPDSGPQVEDGDEISKTRFAQTALVSLEYALFELWCSWGVRPAAVMGHGAGEYAAACAAGVISLEDALKLAGARARLSSTSAVPCPDEFSRLADSVSCSAPRIHFISGVSGRALSGREHIDSSYWRRHATQPVRLAESMRELYRLGYRKFLEIGPEPVLTGIAAECLQDASILQLPSLKKGQDDWQQMLSSLSALFRAGVRVDWEGFDRDYDRRRLSLPTYPFQRKKYWVAGSSAGGRRSQSLEAAHPLLGVRIRSALKAELYENRLRGPDFDFIIDHRVQEATIMPAAAYIEMGIAAARNSWQSGPLVLEKVFIHEPLRFEADTEYTLQTVLTPLADGQNDLQIFSLDSTHPSDPEAPAAGENGRRLHFSGSIRRGEIIPEAITQATDPLEPLMRRCPREIDAPSHYKQLKSLGYDLGASLRTLASVRRGDMEALGHIAYSEQDDRFHFPPALLDGCLQFFWTLMNDEDNSGSYLPMSFEELTILSDPRQPLWSHISLQAESARRQDMVTGDVSVYDDSGRPVAFMKGLALRKAARGAILKTKPAKTGGLFYEVLWEAGKGGMSQSASMDRLVPSPSRIAQLISSRLDTVSEMENLRAHHNLISQIEDLSTAYIFHALQVLGWKARPGHHVTLDLLCTDLGISTKYRRLLNRIMQIMVEQGVLQPAEDGWKVMRPLGAPRPEPILEEILSHPDAARCPQLELAMRCGRSFAEVMRGKADPLALLFPAGSLDLAAQLYSETPEAQVFNSLVRDAVAKAVENLPHGKKARILELGAGTGGATSFVLPGLRLDRSEYFFTDLSPVFLRKAAERFKAFDFVSYRLCDIERGPQEQGFESGFFDVVIAVNALHATSDMRLSLNNARRFLSPGGTMILLEGTAPERWIDITFGLTDGWWAFRDTDLRASYPLLSRRQWIEILKDTGFEDPTAVPGSFDLSHQAVVIARNSIAATERIEHGSDAQGSWIVFAEKDGIGTALAGRIAELGMTCVTVTTGGSYRHTSQWEWSISADRHEDYRRFFEELRRESLTDLRGIIHLWSLEADPPSAETTPSLEYAQLPGSGSLLYLLQAIAASEGRSTPPALFIVTRGAQAVQQEDRIAFHQAPVLGLGKVVTLEHPDLKCRCIDLDPAADSVTQADLLLHEIRFPDEEDIVAYREDRRFLPRLREYRQKDGDGPPAGIAKVAHAIRLEKSCGGVLEELSLAQAERRAPGKGEVEIQVHAAGLGFKDVMNALGMLDDPGPLGFECSGYVAATGEGVDQATAGQEVVALAQGSLATHVTADARFVFPKPPLLSLDEAATLPAPYLTAHYALSQVGKIAAGDKILIHAAAGGVGTAAVYLALKAGAEVFGTAGNTEKRSFLTSIGVHHVMDSRSLDFSEPILRETGGRGVDLVLNSLSGEFISKSLSILAPEGRFLEIGRRGILTSEEALSLRPDIGYHIIDLSETANSDPWLIRHLLKEIMDFAASGAIPPLPLTRFPLSRASEAFRHMAQAKHIGRIAVINDLVHNPDAKGVIHPEATYIVTGGLSGLGLLAAGRLVDMGARHLALIGRSPAGDKARAAIEEMEKKGAKVHTLRADVSVRTHVGDALKTIQDTMPPVRGIIHSAGTLADGILLKQDWERFKRVMAPKIDGAWNLHVLTSHLPLDFFILFSSTAGVLGSPGQGNHAAANAFLDALAHYRRSQGLPALSIDWGVWSDVGSAAQRGADERLALQGVDPISPEQGLDALRTVMSFRQPQVAVIPIDWQRFLPLYAGGITPPWLSGMKPVEASPMPTSSRTSARRQRAPVLLQDLQAASPGKRRELLRTFITNQTGGLMGADPGAMLDPRKPLSEQGLDSLMAVELRNLLKSSLGFQQALPATLVFDYPTIEELTVFIETRLEAKKPAGPPESASGKKQVFSESSKALENIEKLSDDEIDRLLALRTQQRD
jgi:acyl transferase domain-containing protein/acyl carrier protein